MEPPRGQISRKSGPKFLGDRQPVAAPRSKIPDLNLRPLNPYKLFQTSVHCIHINYWKQLSFLLLAYKIFFSLYSSLLF